MNIFTSWKLIVSLLLISLSSCPVELWSTAPRGKVDLVTDSASGGSSVLDWELEAFKLPWNMAGLMLEQVSNSSIYVETLGTLLCCLGINSTNWAMFVCGTLNKMAEYSGKSGGKENSLEIDEGVISKFTIIIVFTVDNFVGRGNPYNQWELIGWVWHALCRSSSWSYSVCPISVAGLFESLCGVRASCLHDTGSIPHIVMCSYCRDVSAGVTTTNLWIFISAAWLAYFQNMFGCVQFTVIIQWL